jgi:hypothetical protein
VLRALLYVVNNTARHIHLLFSGVKGQLFDSIVALNILAGMFSELHAARRTYKQRYRRAA